MYGHDLSCAIWRKSSRSNGSGGNNCVEVAELSSIVAVRDSKSPDGPKLVLTPRQWYGFVDGVKSGQFDA